MDLDPPSSPFGGKAAFGAQNPFQNGLRAAQKAKGQSWLQQSRPQQSRPQQSRPQQSSPQQSRPKQSRPQQSRPQQSRSQQSRQIQQRRPQQSGQTSQSQAWPQSLFKQQSSQDWPDSTQRNTALQQLQRQRQQSQRQKQSLQQDRNKLQQLRQDWQARRQQLQQAAERDRVEVAELEQQTARLRSELQSLRSTRTAKEFWDELNDAIETLAEQGLPISREFAESARNALVQEFGHTPEEANVLLNLRFRDYYKYPRGSSTSAGLYATPPLVMQISEETRRLFTPQAGQQQQQKKQQKPQAKKQQSRQSRQSASARKQSAKELSGITIANNLFVAKDAVELYMGLNKKQQVKFGKVAAVVAQYRKKDKISRVEAELLAELVKGQNTTVHEAGTVEVPSKYNARATRETQMARRVAHMAKKKTVGDAEYRAARGLLKLVPK